MDFQREHVTREEGIVRHYESPEYSGDEVILCGITSPEGGIVMTESPK